MQKNKCENEKPVQPRDKQQLGMVFKVLAKLALAKAIT